MNCAIYCRYSSEKQASGYSIEAQLEACTEYARKNGYNIYKSYIDKATSGTSDDRKAFQEMISDALASPEIPFDAVIVHKLDRFARNRYDSIQHKHILKKRGIRVLSVTQPIIGSGDPIEVILESLLEGMDEFYSLNLARESLKGMIQNAKKGYWNGGPAPYGYSLKPIISPEGKKNSRLVINPREARVVRGIFDTYLNKNMGIKAIAVSLNSSGIKPRTGSAFTKNHINKILGNQKYVGHTVFCRKTNLRKSHYAVAISPQVIENTHPAIISKAIFERVQKKMTARNADNAHPRIHSDSFLLSSLIICKLCGGRYVGTSAKSGKNQYYVCNTKIRKGAQSCASTPLQRQKIEQFVINSLIRYIFSDKSIKEYAKSICSFAKDKVKHAETTLDIIDNDLSDKQGRLKKLYNAIEQSENISLDDLSPRIQELKGQIDDLMRQKAESIRKIKDLSRALSMNKADMLETVQKIFKSIATSESVFRDKPSILRVIDKIEVKNKDIAIYWKIPPRDLPVLTKLKVVPRRGLYIEPIIYELLNEQPNIYRGVYEPQLI